MSKQNHKIKHEVLGYMHPRVWLFLPLFITIGGIAIILGTRFIAYIYHPEVFARSLTTISKTAALEYSTQFFAICMPIIAFCVMIVWYVSHLATRERISILVDMVNAPRLYFFNKMALLFGILSSIFLALLAIISLKDNNALHIYFSYGFFISQVLSFAFDTSVLLQLRKYVGENRLKHKLGFDFRPWICAAYIINALIFYFLYLFKGSPLLADFALTRPIYVMSEYTFVFIGISYATAYRTELRYFINNAYGTTYR